MPNHTALGCAESIMRKEPRQPPNNTDGCRPEARAGTCVLSLLCTFSVHVSSHVSVHVSVHVAGGRRDVLLSHKASALFQIARTGTEDRFPRDVTNQRI